MAEPGDDVELLDAGVRRRLERFGPRTVDRPAAVADGFRADNAAWGAADLRFDAGAGWSGTAWPADPWSVVVDNLTLELRPTASGGLGLYPEHAANLPWLRAQVAQLAAGAHAPIGGADAPTDVAPTVLNLFAHTGLVTLALARTGAAVTHVDGARSAVAWARRNADLSGLADRPIRWIVDGAAAFVAREARRGRRYDGIVLDPPAFGRAVGREWRLETDLPDLLAACRAIARDGAFVLLTGHSDSTDGGQLGAMLEAAFGGRGRRGRRAAVVQLELAARSGAHLALGWAARLGA